MEARPKSLPGRHFDSAISMKAATNSTMQFEMSHDSSMQKSM
jgi:hypothetical protein